MRPESHRECLPERRCGTCMHAHLLEFKGDLLCLHGDDFEVIPYETGTVEIIVEGECVSVMDGGQYDEIWGGRVVDPCIEVCDEWKGQPNAN